MREILIKGSLGIVLTVLAGCGGESSPPAASSPNAATPAAPAAPPTPVASAPPAAPASPAAVPAPLTAPVPPGLAPSTNPDRREQQVKTGRTNPFVPPVPVPIQQAKTTTGQALPTLPRLPSQPGQNVASLPELPVGIGPALPQAIKAASASSRGRGGATGPALPDSKAAQVPGLPELPPAIGPQLPPTARPGRGRQTAQSPVAPGVQVPGVPQLPSGGIGPQLPPTQVARANTPSRPGGRGPVASSPGGRGPVASNPGGRGPVAAKPTPPAPPSLPKAEGQQVPSLPTLPPSIGPALPPAPPTPVGAVPNSPPPPSTDLAKAVEVTGVVQVGNETQIIVKAPNEATSRYVKVGQRLSNGEILVKRVITGSGSEPIIILEQNGVEVAKAVGEKPATADKSSQPTS